MKIKVSREFVIKAIEEETNLVAGDWVRGSPSATLNDPACEVCAVGAVLRRALDPAQGSQVLALASDVASGGYIFTDEEDVSGEALDALARGYPMGALSVYFEGLSEAKGADVEEVRHRVVEFVRTYFPEEVEIDIDGARAAQGVEARE